MVAARPRERRVTGPVTTRPGPWTGPFLDALPLERIAYVHVAGGVERDGLYHDTHAHPTPPAVLELVAELCSRHDPPGVMLERDDDYPPWPASGPTRSPGPGRCWPPS